MSNRTFRLTEPALGTTAPPRWRLNELLTLARALCRLRIEVMRAGSIDWHKIGT